LAKPDNRWRKAQRTGPKNKTLPPTITTNTGYGSRIVERPEMLNKPSKAELAKWERKLPRAMR